MKGKGWKFESDRHALASKGIKTKFEGVSKGKKFSKSERDEIFDREETLGTLTGGISNGFTISCDSKEDRDELIINLIDKLPRWTTIQCGTEDSLVLKHYKLEDKSDLEFKNNFIWGMLSYVEWEHFENGVLEEMEYMQVIKEDLI